MFSKFGVAFIGVFLTPFIVGRIGLVEFGLWALVMNIIVYISLADPGISIVILRYTATHRAAGESNLVPGVIVFGMLVYLALGIILAPLGFLALTFLGRNVHVPPSDVHLATDVFLLGYLYFFLSSAVSVLSYALIGSGDLWVNSIIDLMSRVVYAALAVVFLLSGGNVLSLLLAIYISLAFSFVTTYSAYRIRHGPAFGNPFRLAKSHLKEMLKFGGWVQIGAVADLATTETDPLVIAAAFSVADVGIYEFADTVASQIQFLPLALLAPILTSATTAYQEGKEDQLRRLSIDGNRLLTLLSLGIGGLVAGLGPEIFRAWLGRSYPMLYMFLIFLVTIYSIKNFASVGFSVVTAMGRPDLVAKSTIFGAISNALSTVVLALSFGLPGLIAGSLLGATMRTVLFERQFFRLMKLRPKEDLFYWLWRLALGVAFAALAVGGMSTVVSTIWPGRIGIIASLPVLGIVYTLILICNLRITGFLRPVDAEIFSPYLPGPLRSGVNSGLGRILFGHRRDLADAGA